MLRGPSRRLGTAARVLHPQTSLTSPYQRRIGIRENATPPSQGLDGDHWSAAADAGAAHDRAFLVRPDEVCEWRLRTSTGFQRSARVTSDRSGRSDVEASVVGRSRFCQMTPPT